MNDIETPELLYHAAPQCAYESISEQGLKANFGEVYASDSPGGALSFMWFRLLDHIHPTPENKTIPFQVVEHDRVDIWVIDCSQLDGKKLELGTDHNPEFFGGATSWTHRGDIPPEALIEEMSVTREELLEMVNTKT